MEYKGKYYQINNTGVSGTHELDLHNNYDSIANIQINGDTTLTVKEESLKHNQRFSIYVKYDGSGHTFELDTTKFCSQGGTQPTLTTTDGALNLLEFYYCENHSSCILKSCVTDIRPVT